MFFSDWKKNPKYKDSQISASLLWEYDLTNFDWQKMRRIVVERVLKLGNMKDFYAAIQLYGGLDNFIAIIRNEVVGLGKEDISLVTAIFNIPADDLNSVKRKKAREKALGFKSTDITPDWGW